MDGIHFPAAQLGDFFGLREKRFAFAYAVLGGLLRGDVLGHASDTNHGAGIIDDGNGAGVKNVHLRGPGKALLRDVKFPAAQAGELLGLGEERFVLTGLSFGAADFGDILDDGEDAGGFSGFIRQGNTADKYNALASVWEIVATLGLEGRAILKCGLKDAANAGAIVGMNNAPHGFFAGDAVFGIESVEAEELTGPDALLSLDVILPATGAGNLFGKAALGDVAREQADGMGFLSTTTHGGNAGLKPAPAGGEVHREFDIFADALFYDSAKEPGKRTENFFAQDFEGAAA